MAPRAAGECSGPSTSAQWPPRNRATRTCGCRAESTTTAATVAGSNIKPSRTTTGTLEVSISWPRITTSGAVQRIPSNDDRSSLVTGASPLGLGVESDAPHNTVNERSVRPKNCGCVLRCRLSTIGIPAAVPDVSTNAPARVNDQITFAVSFRASGAAI